MPANNPLPQAMPLFCLRPNVVRAALLLGAALFAGAGLQAADEVRQVFEITDAIVVNPLMSGRVQLAGTVEIKFTGRIAPHDASVYTLVGPGVESLQGKFDRVVVPDGWRYDLNYDDTARTVTLRNLRPDRAPASPGVEGFGKYTVGGRGGRVIEVTNLNDGGPGSFRAAVMASGPRTV